MTLLQYHWDETPPANDIPIEGSWAMMSSHDHFVVICTVLVIATAYLLRNTPFGFVWTIIKMFFIVLFATQMANYIKKEVKDWWRKD